MKNVALVSVICLCYNQANYVIQALDSVIAQTYPHIELIVIDDASTDESPSRIRAWQNAHPRVRCIFHKSNQGICASFNEGFRQSKGHYLIDFAADDLMFPERIAAQVAFFEQHPPAVGVVFSNILWINPQGFPLSMAYHKAPIAKATCVFEMLLAKSFIASPAMMSKRAVFEQMGGYDETLAYEDLDFWFRSAKHWDYGYVPKILTLVRKSTQSYSKSFNQIDNPLLPSAYQICKKAQAQNLSPQEKNALATRIERYLYRAFFTHQFSLATAFAQLLPTPQKKVIQLVTFLASCRLKTNGLFRQYLWFTFRITYTYQKLQQLWKILWQSIPFS